VYFSIVAAFAQTDVQISASCAEALVIAEEQEKEPTKVKHSETVLSVMFQKVW
jgi:hypothetical protein